jgi:hypothetical protein
MGTRGVMAFAIDGALKATYNHWDSYPGGLGNDILKWLRSADIQAAREKARRMFAVNENFKPTPEELETLAKYRDANVSEGDDWYALLRDAQGNPAAALDAVAYVDAESFARDSLFCEWAYVIDLDNEQLEVYKGFQTEVPTAGRWAGDAGGRSDYHAVQLVKTLKFSELPEDFTVLEAELYGEDED